MDIDKLGEQAFKDFWLRWGSRDKNKVNSVLEDTSDSFMGFGSNIDEYWANKDDLVMQHNKEAEQIPEPYNINFNFINSVQLSDQHILVCGEISLSVKIIKKIIILENVRNTLLFKISGNKVLLQHWHCSFPDMGTSGEVVPGAMEPSKYEEVSVFFCDFVGFTSIVSEIPPEQLFRELNDIYQSFDHIMDEEQMEKIQVYGDGYLAVCGIPDHYNDHAIRCINAGKKVIAFLKERNKVTELQWKVRIGIHTGPLVAGVIGERKFSFNIFGDTVNTAARLETASVQGRINISQKTYNHVKDIFMCEHRGEIEVKGKGAIDMYFVN